MKLKRIALVAVTGAAGMFGFGAFHGAQAQCTPTPTVQVCASADPSVGHFTVDSAESVNVIVNGEPNALCVGRITVSPLSGDPVTFQDGVYICY